MRSLLARVPPVLAILACGQRPSGPAPASPQPTPQRGVLAIDTVASGLVHPWAVALLPDGRFLVTERPGRMRIVADGKLSPPLAGVPSVFASGQGGLLDVALDPDFANNHRIFFSFAEPGTGGAGGTAVASATLTDQGLTGTTVIYRQELKLRGGGHFGSRLVFGKDGNLFITQGDRYAPHSDKAQDLSSFLGKVVRVRPDGSAPPDNPFVGQAGARPEIWSYGHRNVQAAALDPATGQLWTVEHGAMGGDELNHPEAGKNYGWPVITYGRDYSGRRIGEGAMKDGMEQPVYYWDPVIAPSGMIFYSGDAFPGWKGSILIGGLASQALVRLTIEGGRVTREERYLGELNQRVRDVQEGPDGFLYIVTDEDPGALIRLRPR